MDISRDVHSAKRVFIERAVKVAGAMLLLRC